MDYLQTLNQVEHLAKTTALWRFLHTPHKYVWAQYLHKVFFPLTKHGAFATAQTFYGHPLKTVLPAATDIYLTGGKTHDSEIRLARFLLKTTQNQPHMDFLDIGAHIGYYAAMMAVLLEKTGRVIAVEPASGTCELLQHNLKNFKNAHIVHAAATETDGQELTFFEFPVLYSEFNSIEIEQFVDETWFKNFQPQKIKVSGVSADTLIERYGFQNPVVKIDAEGAEPKVIMGLAKTLAQQSPIVIMEYLSEKNESHEIGFQTLLKAGYIPHSIDHDGILRGVKSAAEYFKAVDLDSDNFVFLKNQWF